MRGLYLEGERLREGPSGDEMRDVIAGGRGLLWVDLPETEDEGTGRGLLQDVLGLHHLAVDDCFNARVDTPKIDDYRDYLFIISQSLAFPDTTGRLDPVEVDIFLGPNYVVTSRRRRVPAVDDVFERARENPQMMGRGADFLVHAVLDGLVDLMLPAVELMDEQVDELERRILDRPDKKLLPGVLLLKRNTQRLRRAILPQRDLVNRLSRGEFSHLISADALMFYRDVYDHTVRVEELLEGVRDLADGALQSYLSAVNNRMNEVMKVLSVVAVIFLPLTLIASIYGTNLDFTPFGMPGLDGGFYVMIAAMLLIAGGLILYFRRRGWF